MTSRTMLGTGLSLCAVVLVATVWSRRVPASTAAVPKDEDHAQLRQELLGLKQEIAALKRRRLQPPPEGAPAASAETPRAPPAPAPPTREEQEAAMLEARERGVAAVEQGWGREARDPAWSQVIERRIQEAVTTLGSSLPGVKIESSDCGTTMCRVVVIHEDPSSMRGLGFQIARIPPFDHEVMYLYDPDSVPARTTMYVAREGEKLPRPVD